MIRIFIASVYANNKGSDSIAVNDLEPDAVGTYDDDILYKVDQLMLECKERGIQLLITLHDRYALGFWSTDKYAIDFGIAKAGSSGVQQIVDAQNFYTREDAVALFDQRLTYMLNHTNKLLGGKKWCDLSDVIFAFEGAIPLHFFFFFSNSPLTILNTR